MWYIGKMPCCARGAFECRLRGILAYREGLEVVQQYDNAFEDVGDGRESGL